jgi:hypothetical protein
MNAQNDSAAATMAVDTLEFAPANDGPLLKKTQLKSKRYALKDILDSFATSAERPEADFGGEQGEEWPL